MSAWQSLRVAKTLVSIVTGAWTLFGSGAACCTKQIQIQDMKIATVGMQGRVQYLQTEGAQ